MRKPLDFFSLLLSTSKCSSDHLMWLVAVWLLFYTIVNSIFSLANWQ